MMIHISLSIATYILLGITILYSFLAYIQDYQIRHKHIGWLVQKLPPLVVEAQLFTMITLEFVIFSATIISGIILVEELLSKNLIYRIFLTSVPLLILISLLFGHWKYGLRKKTIITPCLLLFAVLTMLIYCPSYI